MSLRRRLTLRVLSGLIVTPVTLVIAVFLAGLMLRLLPDAPVPIALIPSAIVWIILTPPAEWRLYQSFKERYRSV